MLAPQGPLAIAYIQLAQDVQILQIFDPAGDGAGAEAVHAFEQGAKGTFLEGVRGDAAEPAPSHLDPFRLQREQDLFRVLQDVPIVQDGAYAPLQQCPKEGEDGDERRGVPQVAYFQAHERRIQALGEGPEQGRRLQAEEGRAMQAYMAF